jgi:putative ABC transport system permease protein
MLLSDLWGLLLETLRTQRLRTFLTIVGVVIGMASVVLLSSIGEGTRRGIIDQFSQFGTTIMGVTPGKQKTFGVGPGMLGGTTHPLTVEDGLALRRVPGVEYVAPHTMGLGEVKAGERTRRVYIYGTVAEEQYCLRWKPRIGSFLPSGDPDQMPPVCVLGAKTARELFPDANPLHAHIRAGEQRFTVIGVMEPKGQFLGFDMDDLIIIPVRAAMKMFNRQDVMEIIVLAASQSVMDRVAESSRKVLMDRHGGEEDFTIESSSDYLKLLNDAIRILTIGVLLIAGISVFVGAMGILTIMWEIGRASCRERAS